MNRLKELRDEINNILRVIPYTSSREDAESLQDDILKLEEKVESELENYRNYVVTFFSGDFGLDRETFYLKLHKGHTVTNEALCKFLELDWDYHFRDHPDYLDGGDTYYFEFESTDPIKFNEYTGEYDEDKPYGICGKFDTISVPEHGKCHMCGSEIDNEGNCTFKQQS